MPGPSRWGKCTASLLFPFFPPDFPSANPSLFPVLPRLLLLQLKRIGDAVLTAPAVGALRAAWPEAHIALVLAGAAGELAPLFAGADEVLTWQPGGLNLPLLRRLRRLRPDLALDFTSTDRSAFLALASGAPRRASYAKPNASWLRRLASTETCAAPVRELHTIDFHLALAASLGLKPAPGPDAGHLHLPPDLALPPLPPGYALLHPGTARAEKFWPVSHWRALLDHLHGRGLPLVLSGGQDDFERRHIDAILQGHPAPVVDLRGKLNLAQLAGVVAAARLAVTVDTAAMHLAASFAVPQVGLFGPTNPFHWAPRHPRAEVLQAGVAPGTPPHPKRAGAPMASLPWESAAAAADRCLADIRPPSPPPPED